MNINQHVVFEILVNIYVVYKMINYVFGIQITNHQHTTTKKHIYNKIKKKQNETKKYVCYFVFTSFKDILRCCDIN